MNGKGVEQIIELAKSEQASKNREFTVLAEPRDVYYTVDHEGKMVRRVAEAAPLQFTVHSTTALLQVAKEQAPVAEPVITEQNGVIELTTDENAPTAEIYYSAAKVELLVQNFGSYYRTLKHTLPLPLHPVYKKLEALQVTKRFTQTALIRFLRAELNANVDAATIEVFRNLKLSSKGEGNSVVEQGRSSISRSLQQAVKSERGDVIPDELTVTTPVYDLDEMRTQRLSVTVLVDCLPDEHGTPVFELTTVHSSLQAARYDALQTVAFELHKGPYAVIYGQLS